RCRQVDHRPDADHPDDTQRRHRVRRRCRRGRRPGQRSPQDRRRTAGGGPRRPPDRPRDPGAPARLFGMSREVAAGRPALRPPRHHRRRPDHPRRIEGGYFDKLRATPISRMSLVIGRLYAEFVKTLVVAAVMVVVALLFGIGIESGFAGFLVLVAMVSLWAMVFSGLMQLISIKTRSAATQGASMIFFPLLFLTPNFVPREQLTRPMEITATFNPVTYAMEAARSLILVGFDGAALAKGFAVIAVALAIMLTLSARMINSYD